MENDIIAPFIGARLRIANAEYDVVRMRINGIVCVAFGLLGLLPGFMVNDPVLIVLGAIMIVLGLLSFWGASKEKEEIVNLKEVLVKTFGAPVAA